MIKRSILAIVVAFIVWSALDFVIHGLMLAGTYEATAELWRPMEEMKMPLMRLVSLLYILCFVAIYGGLIAEKSLESGLKYGFLFGLAAGISMGFGSYCYTPIPVSLAFSWFAGSLVQCTVAGGIAGAIIKPAPKVVF